MAPILDRIVIPLMESDIGLRASIYPPVCVTRWVSISAIMFLKHLNHLPGYKDEHLAFIDILRNQINLRFPL
jgi:hypothetical protein